MTNIVFLDIDGVLNGNGQGNSNEEKWEIASKYAANLKTLVNSVYNAKIVISSSWRHFSVNPGMFNGRLWREVLAEMLGCSDSIFIGDIPTINNSSSRADEIEAWLVENKAKVGLGTFVILDDECTALKKRFPNNVVDCKHADGSFGFDEAKLNEAIWILSNYGDSMKKASQKVFFTSDSHFCHANIIKYCNRPYASVDEMNADLVKKWNAVVGENDIVWHLGDFCLGKKENVETSFSQLNGKINIVLGNHDRHSIKFYYDIGFNKVYDKPILFNNFFILSHAPVEWVSSDNPFANIFGHVHSSSVYKTFTSRSACVCVERWNYAPVCFEDLLAGMKHEEDLMQA